MISTQVAIDKLLTKRGAQTAIDKWEKKARTHDWQATKETEKADAYRKRVELAKKKFGIK